MSNSENNLRMDYIEFPCADIEATKKFYGAVLGWKFQDFGPEYISFFDGRLAGGFNKQTPVQRGGVLVVLYATSLKEVESKVVAAGGKIVKPVFDFPGGSRFHFTDPNGNELAVWSETR